MLMAPTGTPSVVEKEYIFTTPLEHGLSCKLVNKKHNDAKYKLAQCYKYLDKAIERGNNGDLFSSDYVVNSAGVSVEALGGSFNFSTVVPMLEDYYKSLGFKFVELTGRAGWEKRMKPLGYEFVSVTIRKKI